MTSVTVVTAASSAGCLVKGCFEQDRPVVRRCCRAVTPGRAWFATWPPEALRVPSEAAVADGVGSGAVRTDVWCRQAVLVRRPRSAAAAAPRGVGDGDGASGVPGGGGLFSTVGSRTPTLVVISSV